MGKFASAIIGIVVLALTGCSPSTIFRPLEVKVPVPVGCVKSIPAKPKLPLFSLADASTPDQTVRAYVESIIILEGDDDEMRDLLNGCVDKSSILQ